MADRRTLPEKNTYWDFPNTVTTTTEEIAPPWYSGTPLFSYGIDSKLAEPLNGLPLAYYFSSPFVEGESKDSYFLRTIARGDFRATNLSRDLKALADNPPLPVWQEQLPYRNSPKSSYCIKRDFGFCLYFFKHWQFIDYNWSIGEHTFIHKLEVASGGKILTKQDFRLAGGKYNGNTASYGGISLHEVDQSTLTDEESYNLVRPRVVCMSTDVLPMMQVPYMPPDTAYSLATEATGQATVEADGTYWLAFPDSTTRYGSSRVEVPKFKYLTGGGYVQVLVFVGEFSLKQLHDYICDTTKIYGVLDTSLASYSWGGVRHDDVVISQWSEDWSGKRNATVLNALGKDTKGSMYLPPVPSQKGLFKIDTSEESGEELKRGFSSWTTELSKVDDAYNKDNPYNGVFIANNKPLKSIGNTAIYVKGSYYQQLNLFSPDEDSKIAKAVQAGTGMYGNTFWGKVKIEAYTFDGNAPTGYKPVYLIERETGIMLRETISDKNGKYVLHGIPQGVEYLALSVDPKKTYNSVVEEFGVVE